MSTQPLSPLEQLGQSVEQAQPAQPTTPSQLSPLEQLGQSVEKQQSGKSTNGASSEDQPNLVDKWVANPSTVPNARLRNLPNPAEGMTPGQALLNGVKTGAQVGEIPASAVTLGGIGSVLNPNYGTLGGAVMTHLSEQAGEWATKYPTLIKLMTHAGVPSGVGAVIGYLIHKAK